MRWRPAQPRSWVRCPCRLGFMVLGFKAYGPQGSRQCHSAQLFAARIVPVPATKLHVSTWSSKI